MLWSASFDPRQISPQTAAGGHEFLVRFSLPGPRCRDQSFHDLNFVYISSFENCPIESGSSISLHVEARIFCLCVAHSASKRRMIHQLARRVAFALSSVVEFLQASASTERRNRRISCWTAGLSLSVKILVSSSWGQAIESGSSSKAHLQSRAQER